MENDIRLPTPAEGCLDIGKMPAGLAYDVLAVLALIAIISAPVSLYLFSNSSGASVVARWSIERAERANISGSTLLVLERVGDTWRIVSDASM